MAKKRHPLSHHIRVPQGLDDIKGYVVVKVAKDDPRTDEQIRSIMVTAAANGQMGEYAPDDVIDAKVVRGEYPKGMK